MAFPSQIEPEELGERALLVAEKRGWDAWSLRDVATDLGVTANALYRYVGDKAGLVVAMGEAATYQLHSHTCSSLPEAPKGDADLPTVIFALRFIEFARDKPDRYAAFVNAKPALDHPGIKAWTDLWDDMNAIVRQAVPAAGDAAAFALWAFLHGRIDIANGAAKLSAIDAGVEDAVRAMLTGFRDRSPVPSPLPEHARRDARVC